MLQLINRGVGSTVELSLRVKEWYYSALETALNKIPSKDAF